MQIGRIASSLRQMPNRVLGPIVLGTACLVSSQTITAQTPQLQPPQAAQEEDEATNPNLKTWSKAKFKELASLPEARANEIPAGITAIGNFYKENSVDAWITGKELLTDAKKELTQIFQTSLKLLDSNDSKKQKIGADILLSLKEIFPWRSDSNVIKRAVEVKKYSAPFFSKTIQRVASDATTAEALVRSGLIILKLAQDREEKMPLNFVQGLGVQINAALDSEPQNKKDTQEKQKVLRDAIDQLVAATTGASFYDYAPNISSADCSKVLQILVPSYKRLIERNALEPEYLNSALKTFVNFKNLTFNNKNLNRETKEAVQKDLMSLLDLVLESINKLPKPEDKNLVRRNAFNILQYVDGGVEEQKPIAELLSKKLFTKEGVTASKELFYFFDSVFYKDQFTGNKIRRWHPYVLLKVINDSPEYFTVGVKLAIKDFEKSSAQELNNEEIDKLLVINRFFKELPYKDCQEFTSSVKAWSVEHVEGPISNTFLSCIAREKVTAEVTDRLERKVHNKNWRRLNEALHETIPASGSLASRIVDVVGERLEKDKLEKGKDAVYEREMDFETLGLALRPSPIYDALPTTTWIVILQHLENARLAPTVELVRRGIAAEEHEAVRGLGRALGIAFNHQGKFSSGLFIQRFAGYSSGNETLFEYKGPSKGITPVENLLIDCIRILEGDEKTILEFLPNCSFKVNNDGKFNKKEIDALMRLRRNAFLMLAYSASNHPDKSYKEATMSFLEKRFERYGKLEGLGAVWGDEVASLTELYRSMYDKAHEGNKYIENKMGFLRQKFFDGYSEKHLVEGEERTYPIPDLFSQLRRSMLVQFRQSQGIFREPNKEEEQMLKDLPGYAKMMRELNDAKDQLAARIIQVAPDSSVGFYLARLGELGYGEYQRKRTLETVFHNNEN